MANLGFPIDGTFLSLVAYEGLLLYRESGNVRKVIEEEGARINKLLENLGGNFNKYIKIELLGNDITRMEQPRERNLKEKINKWISKNYKNSIREEIVREIKEISIHDFINKNIIEREVDLERVEEFYGYFERSYDGSSGWVYDEHEFLQQYLELNEGEKSIWLGIVKKEFESLGNSNKFNKFREKLMSKLLMKEGESKETFFKHILPCYTPVYARVGFPEQLLLKILPTHYDKRKILEKVLEARTEKKEKSSEEAIYKDIIQLFQTIYKYKDDLKIDDKIKEINVELDRKNNLITVVTQALDKVVAPQILKCDRYTGFSALEENLLTKQYTLHISTDLMIVCMAGLIRSLILRSAGDYYFLFFSPDEVSKLYLEENPETIRKYFMIKDKAIEILRGTYSKIQLNEVAIMELSLNLELQTTMDKNNLDKISLILFKLVCERNTYKIYEQIPIILYRRLYFRDLIEKYFKNPDIFIKRLADIFNKKDEAPYRVLWRALGSMNTKNKMSEADNAFKAMMYLYRFVILGDPQGYYQFIRELHDCYRKTKNEAYKEILSELRVT